MNDRGLLVITSDRSFCSPREPGFFEEAVGKFGEQINGGYEHDEGDGGAGEERVFSKFFGAVEEC